MIILTKVTICKLSKSFQFNMIICFEFCIFVKYCVVNMFNIVIALFIAFLYDCPKKCITEVKWKCVCEIPLLVLVTIVIILN